MKIAPECARLRSDCRNEKVRCENHSCHAWLHKCMAFPYSVEKPHGKKSTDGEVTHSCMWFPLECSHTKEGKCRKAKCMHNFALVVEMKKSGTRKTIRCYLEFELGTAQVVAVSGCRCGSGLDTSSDPHRRGMSNRQSLSNI